MSHIASKNKIPSLFTYTGSLALSDATMSIIDGQGDEHPVRISNQGVLGIKGSDNNATSLRNFMESNPGQSYEAQMNPQRVDKAIIDQQDATTLVVRYRMIVNANSLRPHTCNNLEVATMAMSFIQRYYELGGSEYLANRYISNILKGLWLHRNLEFRHEGQITVKAWAFGVEPFTFSYEGMSTFTDFKPVAGAEPLVDLMSRALDGNLKGADGVPTPGFFDIEARISICQGMTVYPSQILNMDEQGKRLAYLATRQGERQAILHSQKVGNAIRRIDNWYINPLLEQVRAGNEHFKDLRSLLPKIADGTLELEALPVEPLGIERRLNQAYRLALGTDLFSLLRTLIHTTSVELAGINDFSSVKDDMHYLAACFIRGGLFNSEKDAAEAPKDKNKTSGKNTQ